MEIINVVPHGYCAGVIRAIQTAQKTAKENPHQKITMLGMIVHNEFVVRECERLGIGFVENPKKTREELLDEIDEGIVIFTAHGISDKVREKAGAKGLSIVDAALEACKDRLRPILMTVITMIVGMIPLIIAGGAGANGNRALALGVVGGMSIGTLALVFVVPAFFIVFQTLEEKVNGAPKPTTEELTK